MFSTVPGHGKHLIDANFLPLSSFTSTHKVRQGFQKANKLRMMLTMMMVVVYIYITHANHFKHIFNACLFSFLLAKHIMIMFYWDRNILMLWQVSRRTAL